MYLVQEAEVKAVNMYIQYPLVWISTYMRAIFHMVCIRFCVHFWLYYNSGLLVQYIPRNMHTVFALLCFVVVIHWLIFPYPSGLLHWHCGNLTIAPVPAKQPWWIWISTSCEFIMNDCITTTKQSTTKPCANFSGYTVHQIIWIMNSQFMNRDNSGYRFIQWVTALHCNVVSI